VTPHLRHRITGEVLPLPPSRWYLGVAMGAFASPTGTKLTVHIFVADKGDYYDILDGLLLDAARCADRHARLAAQRDRQPTATDLGPSRRQARDRGRREWRQDELARSASTSSTTVASSSAANTPNRRRRRDARPHDLQDLGSVHRRQAWQGEEHGDALRAQDEYTIEEDAVQVRVTPQVGGRALHHDDRPTTAARCALAVPAEDRVGEQPAHLAEDLAVARDPASQLVRQRENPLPQRSLGQSVVQKIRSPCDPDTTDSRLARRN
jgi:hypothetical protein